MAGFVVLTVPGAVRQGSNVSQERDGEDQEVAEDDNQSIPEIDWSSTTAPLELFK